MGTVATYLATDGFRESPIHPMRVYECICFAAEAKKYEKHAKYHVHSKLSALCPWHTSVSLLGWLV